MRKHHFEKGEDLIEKFLEKISGDEPGLLARVKNDWIEIVGSQVAKTTQPEKFSNGILVVSVNNPVWKRELQLTAGRVIEMAVKRKFKTVKKLVWR